MTRELFKRKYGKAKQSKVGSAGRGGDWGQESDSRDAKRGVVRNSGHCFPQRTKSPGCRLETRNPEGVWKLRSAAGRPGSRGCLQSAAKSSSCAVVDSGGGGRQACIVRKAYQSYGGGSKDLA